MINNGTISFSKYFSDLIFADFIIGGVTENIKSFTSAKKKIKSSNIIIPQQVHSANVRFVNSNEEYLKTDGIVCNNNRFVLCIQVADCVPVYLYEPVSNIIGLVHSGWRGTVSGIVKNAIKIMINKGADKEKIVIFLGPAIGQCCYEVDTFVANQFNKKVKIDNNGKWRVGLHEEIVEQLHQMNIPLNNINRSNICTYENINFQSFRRDGKKSGRMFALMGIL